MEIRLSERDREIVEIAARLLWMLEPPRDGALEDLCERYRADVGDAHVGASAAVLDDMTMGFGGALLLEMDRLDAHADLPAPSSCGRGRWTSRRRVIEALGRYLRKVDRRH